MDHLKEENRRISKEHEKEKSQLMVKIINLQKQLVPSAPQVAKLAVE